MGAVSQLLGESTGQVAAALKSGQTLVAVATSQGVSQDDLVKTIAASFQKANPNLGTDVATQIAMQFAAATLAPGALVDVQA